MNLTVFVSFLKGLAHHLRTDLNKAAIHCEGFAAYVAKDAGIAAADVAKVAPTVEALAAVVAPVVAPVVAQVAAAVPGVLSAVDAVAAKFEEEAASAAGATK